jgi:hypothetical protein
MYFILYKNTNFPKLPDKLLSNNYLTIQELAGSQFLGKKIIKKLPD